MQIQKNLYVGANVHLIERDNEYLGKIASVVLTEDKQYKRVLYLRINVDNTFVSVRLNESKDSDAVEFEGADCLLTVLED